MTATPAPTIDSAIADLPSGRVHYLEAGSGPALVLLHGSGPGATGATNFSPNIGPLADDFRVVVPDMPGWGKSDTPSEVGYQHMDTLIELLDFLGMEQAALVGNSMGGTTAIRAAILHPARVSHLITMGSMAPGAFGTMTSVPGGGLTEGLKVLVHAYQEPTVANMKALVQIMCYEPSLATDELAEARSEAARARPEHLESFHRYFGRGAEASLVGRATEIIAPTLAMHGRDDRVVPWEGSLQLVTQVPDSRLHLINRCGHWAQIEHAAEFNRLVRTFVLGA